MKTVWTKGLDEQLVKDLKGDFLSSQVLRNRLKEIVEDKINESAVKSRSKDNYSSPNWAYEQADSKGYERALTEIISLISN